jgi:hypothetical protein
MSCVQDPHQFDKPIPRPSGERRDAAFAESAFKREKLIIQEWTGTAAKICSGPHLLRSGQVAEIGEAIRKTPEDRRTGLSSTQKVQPRPYCLALSPCLQWQTKEQKAVLIALIVAVAVTLVGLVGYLLYIVPGTHDRLE